jgi:hypothetical protein
MPYPRILPRRIVPGAGRGTGYSRRRRRAEWFLARFFAGGWAAWLARRLGLQPGQEVSVIGLDDYTSGRPDAAAAFAGAAAFRLVLMHDPSTLQAMDGRRFHLALAG